MTSTTAEIVWLRRLLIDMGVSSITTTPLHCDNMSAIKVTSNPNYKTIDAGLVQGWAAIVMGILSGSIPWFTMMVVHKRSPILQKVDDTLGVFHTHAVAGLIGLSTASSPADPLLPLPPSLTNFRGGLLRPQRWRLPFVKQIIGALFIIGWNVVVTTIICLVIRTVVPLRMPEEELTIGDDAVHGEEAYALWGDGEKFDITRHGWASGEDGTQHDKVPSGVTQNV
ncbi:ammonium transporter 3 member 1-like [Asparagus officinalis]|uniref:ammonium transporter 3 member 1-like n=1 Tax=Asparagus officinalis TaxID=4686 RepID=UPI00098E3CE8|nr:ammonium transporter 3 member 1-like [Asparagus officinalis]